MRSTAALVVDTGDVVSPRGISIFGAVSTNVYKIIGFQDAVQGALDQGDSMTKVGTWGKSRDLVKLLCRSPEQLGITGRAVEQTTDAWSLGVVLFRLLSGEYPFDGKREDGKCTEVQLIDQILRSEPDFTRFVEKPGVQDFFEAALNKDPAQRFIMKTMEEKLETACISIAKGWRASLEALIDVLKHRPDAIDDVMKHLNVIEDAGGVANFTLVLLNFYEDENDSEEVKVSTPLHRAAESGVAVVVSRILELLKLQPECLAKCLNMRNPDSFTAFMLACKGNHKTTAMHLIAAHKESTHEGFTIDEWEKGKWAANYGAADSELLDLLDANRPSGSPSTRLMMSPSGAPIVAIGTVDEFDLGGSRPIGSATASSPHGEHVERTASSMASWDVLRTSMWVIGRLKLEGQIATQLTSEFEDGQIDGHHLQLMKKKRLQKVLRSSGHPDPELAAQEVIDAREETASSAIKEAPTPLSARWGPLLATAGPERRTALQSTLDTWHGGRWVIEEEQLGRGSSGVVFRCSDSHLGLVAIKFTHSVEPGELKREVSLMNRVAHPRISRMYEYHQSHDGQMCGMVLELLERGSLAEQIENSLDSRLREFEVVQMTFDVLAALTFMHEKNVIHRDIKPDNIMLTEVDGRTIYKLIDLSVSAIEYAAREDVANTLATGTASLQGLTGTPWYMSPEQFDGDIMVSTQTDLWSLGVVMFECLSGVRPFAQGEHDRNKISYAIVNKEPPELADVIEEVGTVSEGMVAFVHKALLKDLSQRFGTAADMTAAVDEMLTMSGGDTFGLFISYRVWCDILFAEALFTAASKCQLRPGREHRINVYLDKVQIVDGQRFDVNFAKGLASSAVFSPLISANCMKNFVELGQTDKEDFVLAEWVMALELHKQRVIKAIFPVVMGEQSKDGKYSQTFFEGLRDSRVSWTASQPDAQKPYPAGSGTIPDVVSAKSIAKAREFLGMLDPPVELSEELTVNAVVKQILTFQAVLAHFQNDSIDAADGIQLVRMDSTHGKRAKEIARKQVAHICAERIAKVVSEHMEDVADNGGTAELEPDPDC